MSGRAHALVHAVSLVLIVALSGVLIRSYVASRRPVLDIPPICMSTGRMRGKTFYEPISPDKPNLLVLYGNSWEGTFPDYQLTIYRIEGNEWPRKRVRVWSRAGLAREPRGFSFAALLPPRFLPAGHLYELDVHGLRDGKATLVETFHVWVPREGD